MGSGYQIGNSMWDEYEKQKRNLYMDILDSYKNTYDKYNHKLNDFKFDQKALDKSMGDLKDRISSKYHPTSYSVQNGYLLDNNQFKLVTKWLRTDKFFNNLYPKHKKLLNDIIKNDKLPTKNDRVELNKIRDEWIRFIK